MIKEIVHEPNGFPDLVKPKLISRMINSGYNISRDTPYMIALPSEIALQVTAAAPPVCAALFLGHICQPRHFAWFALERFHKARSGLISAHHFDHMSNFNHWFDV
jgi:hypothetical protein